MDVQNYQEGGRNDGVIQRVGRGKYQNIVLKRGMFYGDSGQVNTDLWQWMQDVVSGVRPVARYDGVIEVMSVGVTRVGATATETILEDFKARKAAAEPAAVATR